MEMFMGAALVTIPMPIWVPIVVLCRLGIGDVAFE